MRRRQLQTPERPDINSDSSEKTKEHRSPKRRSIILWGSILLNAIFLTRMAHTRYNRTNLRKQSTKKTTRLSLNHLNDESIVPLPRDSGRVLNLEERLRYLEMKFAARISFGIRDPFVGSDENRTACDRSSDLLEFGCTENHPYNGYKVSTPKCPGYFDHRVCLDSFTPINSSSKNNKGKKKSPPCLVYDFGVRDMPSFGITMAQTFGCEVHAFDPSPVSVQWWESKSPNAARVAIRDDPKLSELYHFHPYGAGGIDGTIKLVDYDWGQVSLLRYNNFVLDCDESKEKGDSPCQFKNPESESQGSYPLEVKTMNTIRKELGHEDRTIDYLKIDVEGSEFAFMEEMLDTNAGCPAFINQMGIEWHHFSVDSRYGEGSSGQVNAIVTFLKSCGFELYWQWSKSGWKSNEKIFHDLEMKDVRYNLQSFIRKK